MWKFFLFLTPCLLASDLRTVGEKSDFKVTGRYSETLELCQAFQKAHPKNVKCTDFGTTPEGRKLLALVVSENKEFSPAQSQKKGKPVLFFQGGIHSGEIDGKDAGFLFLREVLEQRKETLKKVTFVFVPIYNVDGHERFGKYNRPNQVGPEEMGWRTTAKNLNLNRDYAKVDAPETQVLLRFLNMWDPTVYLDLHVTDGADFQPDVAVMVAPSLDGNPVLTPIGKRMSEGIVARVRKLEFNALDFYPSFNKDDDPKSGFGVGIAPPRFSQSYWSAHQRFGILVETHSWKPYKRRVMATKHVLTAVTELAVQEGKSWLEAQKRADSLAKEMAGKPFVLEWDNTKESKEIEFPGYHYEITDSKISGQKRIQYYPEQKEVWKLPFFDKLEAKVTVQAPQGGYLVEAGEADWVQGKLRNHGIEFKILKDAVTKKVEVFRSQDFELGKNSFEGHQSLKVKGKWAAEERTVPAGSLFVPIAQKNSFLVLHLFEPEAKDSFLSWGFFNAHFERKEYMEAYVSEQVAETMLKDPNVREAFEARLKEKEFAENAEKRLDFFYERHPSWDERFGLYPVYRTVEKSLNSK